jgi:hypothetical protein
MGFKGNDELPLNYYHDIIYKNVYSLKHWITPRTQTWRG